MEMVYVVVVLRNWLQSWKNDKGDKMAGCGSNATQAKQKWAVTLCAFESTKDTIKIEIEVPANCVMGFISAACAAKRREIGDTKHIALLNLVKI